MLEPLVEDELELTELSDEQELEREDSLAEDTLEDETLLSELEDETEDKLEDELNS